LYVRIFLDDNINSVSEELSELLGQLSEKYFDYFVFNIIDYSVNCGLLRLGARRRELAQTIGNARGLDINSLGVWKITLKTCDFVDISNTAISTALGGSTTASLPIVIVILRQQLDYVIIDYAVPTKSDHIGRRRFFGMFKSIPDRIRLT
jgi:hypothetical protein